MHAAEASGKRAFQAAHTLPNDCRRFLRGLLIHFRTLESDVEKSTGDARDLQMNFGIWRQETNEQLRQLDQQILAFSKAAAASLEKAETTHEGTVTEVEDRLRDFGAGLNESVSSMRREVLGSFAKRADAVRQKMREAETLEARWRRIQQAKLLRETDAAAAFQAVAKEEAERRELLGGRSWSDTPDNVAALAKRFLETHWVPVNRTARLFDRFGREMDMISRITLQSKELEKAHADALNRAADFQSQHFQSSTEIVSQDAATLDFGASNALRAIPVLA